MRKRGENLEQQRTLLHFMILIDLGIYIFPDWKEPSHKMLWKLHKYGWVWLHTYCWKCCLNIKLYRHCLTINAIYKEVETNWRHKVTEGRTNSRINHCWLWRGWNPLLETQLRKRQPWEPDLGTWVTRNWMLTKLFLTHNASTHKSWHTFCSAPEVNH